MDAIRQATNADVFRLAEIEIFNYRLFFYPIFRTDRYFFSELSVPVLIEEYRREPERIARTLVYDDGVVKGFIRVNGEEIEKLFTEPAFHDKGIGGMLLDAAVDRTGAKRLLVLEKNADAVRFYQRHCFHVTDKRQPVDDTNERFIVMER